jgi:hypothetical protein
VSDGEMEMVKNDRGRTKAAGNDGFMPKQMG